jgi:hypothetical protein
MCLDRQKKKRKVSFRTFEFGEMTTRPQYSDKHIDRRASEVSLDVRLRVFEASRSSETLVPMNQSTLRHVSEDP